MSLITSLKYSFESKHILFPIQHSFKMEGQKIMSMFSTLTDQLNSLLSISAQLIERNSQIDNGLNCDIPAPNVKFETALEDFLSSCNSLELNLKTIQECLILGRLSAQNLPISVSSTKPDLAVPQNEIVEPKSEVTYNQYLNIIRFQVDTARSIQALLEDIINKQI